MTRISEWTDYLKEEIDDKIGVIMDAHKTSYSLCEANVVADEIRKVELQDVWEKVLRLQEQYDVASKEINALKSRLENAKHIVVRELELPYWSSDANYSLHNQIATKYRAKVDAMFESLPEGEEIVELRKIRDGIEHKLQVANMDKRLVPAIRQICEAVGIEIEGMEE